MKRSPFTRKPGKPMKRTPMKRSTTPMNKIGKQGKKNAKADRESKKDFEKLGVDYCQLCGRTSALGRSHSHKRRHETDLVKVALLCNFPCHNFIEYRLDPAQQEMINDFIIKSDLVGEYKFEATLALLPKEKADEMREAIINYKG